MKAARRRNADEGAVINIPPKSINLCGESMSPDASGALYWPAEETLVVADLHLEKGSAYAKRGRFLPPYDTRATLARLSKAVERLAPRRIIALGDSFHDVNGTRRLSEADRETIAGLQSDRHWIWVTGNHDPLIPGALGGSVVDQTLVGGITFRHEPSDTPATHEIAGHLHPAARISCRGRSLRRRCFVSDGNRLILPAFGSFTGGLNVCDPAFARIFGPHGDNVHLKIWIVGADGVYPIAPGSLKGD